MLKIRLSMGGVKKRPIYKIVIADSRYPRDGKFVEKVGSFNPLLPKEKKERIKVEAERIKYWLSKGAQPTLRVSRILETLNVGCAPLLNQYFILSASTLILSFFSFGSNGLNDPTFSTNFPSLGYLLSAITILYIGLFFTPPIDSLIFNILYLSF